MSSIAPRISRRARSARPRSAAIYPSRSSARHNRGCAGAAGLGRIFRRRRLGTKQSRVAGGNGGRLSAAVRSDAGRAVPSCTGASGQCAFPSQRRCCGAAGLRGSGADVCAGGVGSRVFRPALLPSGRAEAGRASRAACDGPWRIRSACSGTRRYDAADGVVFHGDSRRLPAPRNREPAQ